MKGLEDHHVTALMNSYIWQWTMAVYTPERDGQTLAFCSMASEGPAVLRGWKQSLIRPPDLITHVEEAQGTEVTPYNPIGSKRDGEGTHLQRDIPTNYSV